jgi:type I restriction enzyme S subunit
MRAGVNFVKVESISEEGTLISNKFGQIDNVTHHQLERSILQEGDLLFTIAGTIGRVAKVMVQNLPANTNQAVAIIRPDKTKVDGQYLYYVLRNPELRSKALTRVVQSVQANFSLSELSNIEIEVPPLKQQQHIAQVLSSFDELIQLNKQLLSSHMMIASEIVSHLSMGGETLTFGDVVDVFGGGTPSTKEPMFWNGEVPWATPTDLTALPTPYLFSTSRMITQEGLASCSSRLFPVGSILMTSRATIGVFAINQIPVAVNQGFIVVQPRNFQDRWFLFHEMLRRVPEFIQRSNGSTFLEISRGVFKSLPIVWPSEESRKKIDEKLTPIHASALALQLEISELTSKRDELLPLLLSGAITAKEVAA